MKTLTDEAAKPCTVCKTTRAFYALHGKNAERKCAKGHTDRISVSADVPRKVVTVEQWRAWWHRIDNAELPAVA